MHFFLDSPIKNSKIQIMKKLILLLSITALFFTSCLTTKPIKVDALESDVFVVNRIVVKSSTIQPTDEELIQIFKQLPYAEFCDYVEEKTGIVLDMYYFDEEYVKGNIEYSVLYDIETDEELEELPEWELNLEVSEEETQFCDLIFTMDPPDGYLNAQAVMHTTQTIPATKEGKEDKDVNLQSKCYTTFEKWTYKSIFVDPRSCAQIKFHKNIKPTFIENELFSVYKVLNQTEDGFINVNVKEPVEIRCNIDDPGSIFSSPAEIFNATFTETFQPGKQYLLKYKLKRTSPDSAKWIVVFKLKEIKPSLGK